MKLYESITTNLKESALTDVVNEYYERLSKFLSKYDITFEVGPKYITYYYKGKYIAFDNLIKSIYEKGRLRTKIRHIQYSINNDDYLPKGYLKAVYGDRTVYKNAFDLKPEYNKMATAMRKDLKAFVSSCKDLENRETQIINDMDKQKEEKTNKLLGDNAIVLEYKPQGDAPYGANIYEVKQRFSDIKHVCEKVGSKYYFKFNRKDAEEVKRRYDALKDIADVTLRESSLKESYFSDVDDSDGIFTYSQMLYGQEPQSEYDKMIIKYQEEHDAIRKEIDELKNKYSPWDPEYKKQLNELVKRDRKNQEFKVQAEQIPAKERGPLFQDWLEIDSANDDDFARQRGYKDFKSYTDANFGLHDSEEKDAEESNKRYGVSVKHDILPYRNWTSYINAYAKNEEEAKKEVCARLGVTPSEVTKVEKLAESDDIDYFNATPEEIDDYYSSKYYKKTQEDTDPEEKFKDACYTAASQWMSAVTEETSKEFIRTMILPIARNAYDSPDHTDDDYMDEIIFNLANERGIDFDFERED